MAIGVLFECLGATQAQYVGRYPIYVLWLPHALRHGSEPDLLWERLSAIGGLLEYGHDLPSDLPRRLPGHHGAMVVRGAMMHMGACSDGAVMKTPRSSLRSTL